MKFTLTLLILTLISAVSYGALSIEGSYQGKKTYMFKIQWMMTDSVTVLLK